LKKYFLFFPLVFLFLTLFPTTALEIGFNKNVCYFPLSSNPTLIISYTHSVSLTKVVDIYRINKTGIYAIQEKWQEFMAGQPLDVQYTEGQFYVKDMNMYLGKSWEYWFIPLNNVTVKISDKIVFTQLKEEGIMKFKVKKVPFVFSIIRRC